MNGELAGNVLYADFELDSANADMFVVTPEGNYFNFPGSDYNEQHEDISIIDSKSHLQYIVKFKD
jgi:hypothetical protein